MDQPRRTGGASRVVAAAVGVVVLVLLVHALGPSRVVERLSVVRGGFGLMLAAYFLATLIYAVPLSLVLPAGVHFRHAGLVASRFAAVSVNAATPFLGVGGEPVRLLWLPSAERRDTVASLFVDRAAFLSASALYLVLGTLTAALTLTLPRAAKLGLLTVSGVALVLAAALCVLQRNGLVALPAARLLSLFAPKRREAFLAGARQVDEQVQSLHLDRPLRFFAAIGIHLVGRAVAALEVLVAVRLLGIAVGLGGVLVLATLPLVVDLVFSMIPSQLGVHEGANALMARALGFEPAAGLALAFLQRLRQVIFVAVGFLLLALRKHEQGAR